MFDFVVYFQPTGNKKQKCSKGVETFNIHYTYATQLVWSESLHPTQVYSMSTTKQFKVLLYLIGQKGKFASIVGIIVIQDLGLSGACDRQLHLLHSQSAGPLAGGSGGDCAARR